MSTFHVRLLGGFAIESPSTKASPSLSQRRPEAVLAVLAVCGDLGCTRERVIGLLWPERDEATARHNLRDALYAIRKVLGREAITGTGDMLHLDPDVVSTDVQQFRAALRDDRLADAVALYGGPLLDGFHPGDALEFERWLEDARARLFRERQDAVKELARRAEGTGRWDEAARWWARAVAADPYDTRLVAQRVIALARSGDRANAVLEGEAHVQRLRTDLDLDPGDPFLEELGRVRSGEISATVPPSGSGAGAARAPARRRPAGRPREMDGPPVADYDPGSSDREAGPRSRYGLLRWGVVGAGIGLMLAATILVARWGATASPDPGLVDPVQVTTATGIERSPAWSPDGRALAYESSRNGDSDIWVAPLGTGESVNRTAGSGADDLHPRWSPDGRWISFFSYRSGGGYYVMPALGGSPRRVAPWPTDAVYPARAAWSPDGTRLAFALGQRQDPWLRIVALDGTEVQRLALPARPRNRTVADITWSPDGRFLAYRRAISPIAATAELWLTDVATGESVRLTDGAYRDTSPTWGPDATELLFVSDRGGSPDLWRLEVGGDESPTPPERITAGMELTEAALGPEGRRLAYTRGRRIHNVFRAPIRPDSPASWDDVTRLTFDEADFESIDVDRAGRLLLSSNRSGNWDIYLQPPDARTLRRLTADSALDAGPSWKPGSDRIAYYSDRTGHRQIWLMSLDGGTPQQLTYGATEKLYPRWSPDGREIVAAGTHLWVFDVDDGSRRVLARTSTGGHPDWSPDGRWIAFSRALTRPYSLTRVPAAGGAPERLTEIPGRVPRWSPDGEKLYFLGMEEHADTVWELSLETRAARPITALTGRPGHLGRIGLATDGRYIYFTWRVSRGDLWVADLHRPPVR